MKEHAEELGIRDDQLFVGGESAGGGLAVAVSLMARDRREVNIAFLMPLYPMLDCEDTDSSRDNHGRVWNTRRNHYAWKRYLREIDGPVPSYASPAREKKYRKLPPTYTFVCEGEPFYDETKAYIWKLRRADVKAEMDIFPGNVHAFDMLMPWKKDSIQAKHNFQRQFDNAVRNYRAPQPGKEDLEDRGRIKRK
jgi:acetyl esterase/lipase